MAKLVIGNVLGQLLCSKMVIPVWHIWIPSPFFQTICLLWGSHCCHQGNDLSPSDVSGQQSIALRSWPSCVVPFVYGEVVLSPQCTNLCSPGYIEQHKLHDSVYAWVFKLWRFGIVRLLTTVSMHQFLMSWWDITWLCYDFAMYSHDQKFTST